MEEDEEFMEEVQSADSGKLGKNTNMGSASDSEGQRKNRTVQQPGGNTEDGAGNEKGSGNPAIENEESERGSAETSKPKRKRRTRAEIKAAAEAENTEVEIGAEKPDFQQNQNDPFADFNPEINPEAKAEPIKEENPDVFDDNYEEPKTATGRKKRTPSTRKIKAVAKGQLVDGYMLLLATDLIAPYVINMMFPKNSVKELKLTPEELNELRPFADEAAKFMSVSMNPILIYGLFSFGIYAAKLK